MMNSFSFQNLQEVMEDLDIKTYYQYEQVKEKITAKLVNGKNPDISKRVCTHYNDMAIVYDIQIREVEEGYLTLKIVDKLLNEWGISKEELHKQAMINTFKENIVFESLLELLTKKLEEIGLTITDEMEIGENDKINVYVLTNEKGINGAIEMLNNELMSDIAEQLNCSYYIIPSSIHEIMILPEVADGEEIKKKELEKILRDVNRNVIQEEDVLSQFIYKFNKDTKELKIERNKDE